MTIWLLQLKTYGYTIYYSSFKREMRRLRAWWPSVIINLTTSYPGSALMWVSCSLVTRFRKISRRCKEWETSLANKRDKNDQSQSENHDTAVLGGMLKWWAVATSPTEKAFLDMWVISHKWKVVNVVTTPKISLCFLISKASPETYWD